MDWVRSFQKSIDYIEAHITEPLSYERIAQEMNISGFYYQKIFSILCGMPPGEYIRNRRLALAGSELMGTDARVIDVALKYGYDTPEGFARAFTRFHGVTPMAVKKGSAKLKSFSRLCISISLKGGNSMQYRIEEKESFKMIARSQRFVNVAEAFGREDIPAFWEECYRDGTVKYLVETGRKDGVLGDNIVGMCMEDSTQVEDFPYAIGAEYSGGGVPEGYEIFEIPAATWLVFETTGCMPHAMQKLWHQIFADFFPASDYKPVGNIDLEVYSCPADMENDNYHSEIWITVEKK